MRTCDILAKPCWVTTFEPSLSLSLSRQNPLQMILVLALCKTLTPPLATDHLSSKCINPFSQDVPLSIACLLPNGTSAIKLSPLQLKSTFPQISPDDHVTKLGARQKLWKCFWRLNANVRFQIELKHFALTIATKNVYNQKYFPSMPRIESCAAQPKIVPMVTIVKI